MLDKRMALPRDAHLANENNSFAVFFGESRAFDFQRIAGTSPKTDPDPKNKTAVPAGTRNGGAKITEKAGKNLQVKYSAHVPLGAMAHDAGADLLALRLSWLHRLGVAERRASLIASLVWEAR